MHQNIIQTIKIEQSRKAYQLLMQELEQFSKSKSYFHAFWRGMCLAYDMDANNQIMRQGCDLINRHFKN